MRAAAVRVAGWVRRLAWARLCAAEARRREEERQRRALQVIWKVVVPWLARRALRFKKRRLAVLRGMVRFKGYALCRNQPVRRVNDISSLSRFSAMTRPSWLRRAVRNRHHHAIDATPTRRKILISTQMAT